VVLRFAFHMTFIRRGHEPLRKWSAPRDTLCQVIWGLKSIQEVAPRVRRSEERKPLAWGETATHADLPGIPNHD
jgi:hypothetical protein